ncbi:MAG: hypothetical protein ACEQSK_09680, partial [Sphingomonadaceae bacterium]
MNSKPLTNLLTDLLGDLNDPSLLWQLGAIALSVLLGWGLARALKSLFGSKDERHGVMQFGVESFGRVVGPIAIVCLLALAKTILARWHHVNLLKVALPIFGSLVVIRFTFYLLRRIFAREGDVSPAMLTFEKIFQLLVWLAFVLYITGIWVDVFDYLDDTVLPIGKHKISIAAILQGSVSVVLTLMLALWAGAALDERLMHMQAMHSNLRVVLS